MTTDIEKREAYLVAHYHDEFKRKAPYATFSEWKRNLQANALARRVAELEIQLGNACEKLRAQDVIINRLEEAQKFYRACGICADCKHPMSKHDPEDFNCETHDDEEIGVCRCKARQRQLSTQGGPSR